MPRPIYRLAFIVQRLLFDMRRRGRAIDRGEEKDMHQNVRSAPMPSANRQTFGIYKIVAVAVWLAGAWTTYLLISRMVDGQVWYASAIESMIIQGFLTALESPVWRRRAGPVNVAAVVVDTLANAGGIFPFMENIGATPPAQMFIKAFQLDGNISPIVAVSLALVFGFILAAGPEALWRWE